MSKSKSHPYSIGSVAKMTGLSSHIIRKWEDRYQVVSPQRSSGGDRRYSEDDVAQLRFLKELVDAGNPISKAVSLRVSERQAISGASIGLADVRDMLKSANVLVYGDSLSAKLKQNQSLMPRLSFADQAEQEAPVDMKHFDAVILERSTLNQSVLDEIQQLRIQTGVECVVVVYGFAKVSVATQLTSPKTACMRLPLNYPELQRLVLSMVGNDTQGSGQLACAPPRYSEKTLAKVAAAGTSINCECPRHISDLILSLKHFESYCFRCESDNPEDSMLHRYLALTAGHARTAFESALTTLAEHENIPLEQWEQSEPD